MSASRQVSGLDVREMTGFLLSFMEF